MGMYSLDGQLVLYDEATRTYYVDGEPLCLAERLSTDNDHQLCSLKAGHGTSHLGTGRCKYHGGELGTGIVHMTTTRYAKVAPQRLRQQMELYASDPEVLDLTPELILLRSILSNVMEMYQDIPINTDDGRFAAKWMVDLIERIGQMVERIERINQNHILTAANAKYIMLRAIEVARAFVPQEYMDAFVEQWRTNVVEPVSRPEE